ncbi:hypothetical protein C4D60_Mb01t00670 [Musa balbisiana]|uniref:Phytocyanin domain-containing protein n=1 Tax=Musa balbisiana TaxID=52838 RepID=A0A4S8JIW7_MUSBA|nr:hypothetical protein C4D60_Mb01t00670 [Musa balbisiana]
MEISKSWLSSLVFVGVLMGLVTSSGAYVFYVGGRDGWVSNPSESYDSWAGRNRFQVNDTLVFRYKKGTDSVLVVTKQDYDACNVSNPIQKLEGGDSMFNLGRSGPFFFISGVPDNCRKGQKLLVVVLAVRNGGKPSPSPPSPPPAAVSPSPLAPSEPPTSSPASSPPLPPSPSSSASPSPSPTSPSPESISQSPSPSPARSPSPSPSFTSTPATAPTPTAEPPNSGSPASAPSPASISQSPSPSPARSPSPSSSTLTPATAPTPTAEPPNSGSPPPPPSSPSGTPSTPESFPSQSVPPPSPSSSSIVSASSITLGLIAMILGGAFLH